MIRPFLTAVFLLLGYCVLAQDVRPTTGFEFWNEHTGHIVTIDVTDPDVRGTPFYNDNWRVGAIYLLNGDSITKVKMKYNAFEDEIYAEHKLSGQTIILERRLISAFSMTDVEGSRSLFRFDDFDKQMTNGPKKGPGFFEVLHEGNYSLYCKHNIKFKEADYSAYSSADYDQYILESPQYFALAPDSSFILLKKGNKGVLKSLEDDGRMAKILKENKLDVKTTNDLVSFFKLLD